MKISTGSWCSAVNCGNNRGRNPNLSFFRFPKEPLRCKQWVTKCGREDLVKKNSEYLNKNCRLCSLHFEDNQFMNSKKHSLVHDAIPTLFNISNSTSKVLGVQCEWPHQIQRRKAPTIPDTSQMKTKLEMKKEIIKLVSIHEREDAIVKNLRNKLYLRQFLITKLRIRVAYLERKLKRVSAKKRFY